MQRKEVADDGLTHSICNLIQKRTQSVLRFLSRHFEMVADNLLPNKACTYTGNNKNVIIDLILTKPSELVVKRI